MLLEKYRPKSTMEIIGNYYQIKQIKEWLNRWDAKGVGHSWKKGKTLMIVGPSGCGKSISVELACKESDFPANCSKSEGVLS